MADRPGEHIHTEKHPAKLSANEARQGGRPVSTMVAMTTALIVLAVIGVILLVWFWAGSPGTPG